MLNTLGPDFGYFSNGKERWIIAKPKQERQRERSILGNGINITVKAKIHLVAAISSREYREDFVSEKVSDWVSEVVQLAKFAERRGTGMLC